MSAQYLVRFDDLCPTANWCVWNQVEALLLKHDVRPMVAVVPDNRDPELMAGDADPEFWSRVRTWQSRGWAMGLHGYQHCYVTRHSGLIGRNRYSEFAGVEEREQRAKIAAGLRIFADNAVRADVWIAPAHSFDRATIRVLAEAGVDTISDGYALEPFRTAEGHLWVPQQIARFRPLPYGVWTVCLHVNGWTAADIAQFERDLCQYGPAITTLDRVRAQYATRQATAGDRLFAQSMRSARALRSLVHRQGGQRQGAAA